MAASFSTNLGLVRSAALKLAPPSLHRSEHAKAVEPTFRYTDRVEQQLDRLRIMLSGRRSLSTYEKRQVINALYEVPYDLRPEFVRRMMGSYVRDENGFAWNLTRRALYLLEGGVFSSDRYYNQLVDYLHTYNSRIDGWRVHRWNDGWWRTPVAIYIFFWWPNYSDPWNDPWSGHRPSWPAPRDPWMDRWGSRDPWESGSSDPWGGSGHRPSDPWEGPAQPPRPNPPSDPWDPPSPGPTQPGPKPPESPRPEPPSDPWEPPPSRPKPPESPRPEPPSDPWEPPPSPPSPPSIPQKPSEPKPSPGPSEPESPSHSDPW